MKAIKNIKCILGLFIILIILKNVEGISQDIPKCYVLSNKYCIKENNEELKKGDKCISYDNKIYIGLNDVNGECTYYNNEFNKKNEIINNYIREDGTGVSVSVQTDLQTEAVTDAQTEAVTDAQTEAVTDAQTEAVTDAQTEAVTDAQTEAPTDAQTEAPTDVLYDNIYYLFKDKEMQMLEDGDNTGYLFKCDNVNTCELIKEVGYYVNDKDNIYYCISSDDDKNCKKTSAEENCTSETIGKLVYDKNDNKIISICIDYANSTPNSIILSDDAGDYVLNYKEGNIYGITNNKFALIMIKKDSVTLNKKYNDLKYIYANVSSNKLLEKNTCPDNDHTKIFELKCQEGICEEGDN